MEPLLLKVLLEIVTPSELISAPSPPFPPFPLNILLEIVALEESIDAP